MIKSQFIKNFYKINKIMKFYLTFCSIFFITFSSYAVPVGGITKFFKGLFSKSDEIIDISSKTGKSTNELSNEISELLRFIDPETYKGQSFQEIIDEISAFNAEPIEGLKKFYNPSENVSSAMSNDDYSLWLEYYSACLQKILVFLKKVRFKNILNYTLKKMAAI